MTEATRAAQRSKAATGKTQRTNSGPGTRLARSPVHLLHRAGQCAEEQFMKEFADSDITPRQYAVLVAAQTDEGCTQTDIVMMTGIDRSTLADLVRRLVAKGLLQRRRSRQDARAYNVRLSEAGARLLQRSAENAARVDARLLSAVPAADRGRFIELLDQVVRRFAPGSGSGH